MLPSASQLTEAQFDVRGRTLHLLTARWLRTETAAVYAGYDSTDGWVLFAQEHGVIPVRRGRVLLWDRLDIDSVFERLKRQGLQGQGGSVSVHASTVGRRRAPRHGSDFTSRADV